MRVAQIIYPKEKEKTMGRIERREKTTKRKEKREKRREDLAHRVVRHKTRVCDVNDCALFVREIIGYAQAQERTLSCSLQSTQPSRENHRITSFTNYHHHLVFAIPLIGYPLSNAHASAVFTLNEKQFYKIKSSEGTSRRI